jgi:ParB family chromosome partitioning protein
MSEQGVYLPGATARRTGDSDERYTPPWLAELARQVLGAIDLDPASCAIANQTIGAAAYYDKAQSGLDQPWAGRVWLNPPYSTPRPWAERLIREYARGHVTAALLLLNADPGTHIQQQLARAYPCCQLAGRGDFFRPDGTTEGNNRYAQTVFYLGRAVESFVAVFDRSGAVQLPARPRLPIIQESLL